MAVISLHLTTLNPPFARWTFTSDRSMMNRNPLSRFEDFFLRPLDASPLCTHSEDFDETLYIGVAVAGMEMHWLLKQVAVKLILLIGLKL